MMAKERLLSCSQAKQSVLDSIISSGKRTATGEKEKQKRTEKEIESETLDTTIASFSYETLMGPEEWYEMYVRPFHPELA